METYEKIILDNVSVVNGLQEIVDKSEKASKEFVKLEKDISNTAAKGGKAMVDAGDKINRTLKTETQLLDVTQKAYKATSEDVALLAFKMLSAGNAGKEFKDVLLATASVDMSKLENNFEVITDEVQRLASEMNLTDHEVNILENNVEDLLKELFKMTDIDLENLPRDAQKATTEFSSLKAELRALTNLINSGQLTGKELDEAKLRAGELKDRIGDTADEIKRLASDTQGLDNLVETTQLAAGGFALLEGAQALFGDESEDLQKALVRLNAVMAISNGLQEVGQILTNKGGIATKGAAIAQAIYTTTVGTSTGALRIFRLALLGTGIGLFVVVLGTLIANWDKVKKSVDENSKSFFEFGKRVTTFLPPLNLLIKGIEFLYNNFSRLDNIASGVIDGVVAGLGVVGEVVSKIFDGDFSGAYASAKKLGGTMSKAINEGIATADKADADKAIAKQLEGTIANNKNRLAVLQAGGKETYQLQKKILDDELKQLKLSGADKEKIAEKEIEIEVSKAARKKELNDKYVKDEQDRIKKEAAAQEQLIELREKLFDLNKELGNVDLEAQFNFVKQRDLADLEKLKAQLIEIGQTLKKDVTSELADVEKAIDSVNAKKFEKENFTLDPVEVLKSSFPLLQDALNQKNEIEFLSQKTAIITSLKNEEEKNKELEILDLKFNRNRLLTQKIYLDQTSIEAQRIASEIAEINDKLAKAQTPDDTSINQRKKNALETIENEEFLQKELERITIEGEIQRIEKLLAITTAGTDQYIDYQNQIFELRKSLTDLDEIKDFESLWKNTLDDIFGPETAGKIAKFIEGVSSIFSTFGDLTNENTQLNIDAIDKELEALAERREVLQEGLDKELEDKEKGYASSVGSKQEEVDALLAEENKLNAEREKLQKQAEKRKLISETVQQTQALITTSIELYKSFAPIPFGLGIPLAIAAIASMFGFFAATKVKAFKATSLWVGAEKISDHFGLVQKGGPSDKPGRGGAGFDVIDSSTGIHSGVKISGNEMIIPETTTEKQYDFFVNLKNGEYDNMDLAHVIDSYSNFDNEGDNQIIHQTIVQNIQYPSKQWIPYTDKKGVTMARLVDIPKDESNSIIIFE